MTKKQQEKVKEKSRIRPSKILEATEWLIANNSLWENINMDDLRSQLSQPVIVVDDQSTEVDGYQGSNIKEEETF